MKIQYYDEDFNFHEEERFEGIQARIMQHEYDHTEGILFVDRLPAFKKMLLKRKLSDISVGKHKATYKMIYPKKRIKH